MNPRARASRAEELLQLHQTVSQLAEQARTLDLEANVEVGVVLDRLRALGQVLNDARVPNRSHILLDLLRVHVRLRVLDDRLDRLDPTLDLVCDHGRGCICKRSVELSGLLESVERRLAVMVGESGPEVDKGAGSSGLVPVRPGRAGVRLNRWAVRLLPAWARARYAEELLDELYALAEDGAGWWRQLACGLRQVIPGTWRIRVALRHESRPSRAPGQGA